MFERLRPLAVIHAQAPAVAGRAARFLPGAGIGGAPAMTTIAGLDAPDAADALALTFAQQVAPVKKAGPLVPIGCDYYPGGEGGWIAERVATATAARTRSSRRVVGFARSASSAGGRVRQSYAVPAR